VICEMVPRSGAPDIDAPAASHQQVTVYSSPLKDPLYPPHGEGVITCEKDPGALFHVGDKPLI